MSFFIDGVVKLFFDFEEVTLLSILIHGQFSFFNEAPTVWILHEAHELTVAWVTKFNLKHGTASGDFVFRLLRCFSFISKLVTECILAFDQLLDEWAVATVLLSVRNSGRSGNDERCPSFIDEDGVDLVNNGEVVPALHLFLF